MSAGKRHISPLLLILSMVVLLCLNACNTSKNIPAGDKLYTGAKIIITDKKVEKGIKKELEKVPKPQPNTSLLGIRYKLMLYNAVKEPKRPKGFMYKVKHKWGEAPVLLSQVRTAVAEQRMGDILFNNGYLKPKVTSQIISKDSATASINYTVDEGIRYKIRNIFLPEDSSQLTGLISNFSKESLLKKGAYFDLNVFKLERERIDDSLKNHGYFFFVPDLFLFRIDSLHLGEADVYLTLKPDIASQALKTWSIGNITIYSNYRLGRDSIITAQAGTREKKYTIVDKNKTYKPYIYDKAVVIKENQLYKKNQHTLTIERLMNLQTFKFVKMAFIPVRDSVNNVLNTRIYLTPAQKQTLRLELSGNSKSNNYIGSEISLNYRNVNWQKGAEIFEAKIAGGFDVQIGGNKNQASPTAISFTAETNLYIPRLIPYFKVKLKRNPYLPRTVITPAITYIKRPDLYTLRSISISGGYHWKQGRSTEHKLRVININAINPTDITAKFDSMMAEDVTLKAAFEKQLVIGTRYQYTYNNTYRNTKRFNYAFDAYISTSGNVVNLLIPAKVDTPGAKQLFNIPVAQYIRMQLDVRGYWKLTEKIQFVNRIIGGYGYAYGNSVTVPYSEQFFIGGSSSIRAFRSRTLGPGSYHTEKQVYNANESGEIKFELNSEFRFNVSKYVKLAAFTDAGNIWLRKDAVDKPGSGLGPGDFFKEMAVGSGVGVRFDAAVLVIRFDVATPIRKPWYPEGNRWVINQIDLGNSTWRKENVLMNIGIGYPF